MNKKDVTLFKKNISYIKNSKILKIIRGTGSMLDIKFSYTDRASVKKMDGSIFITCAAWYAYDERKIICASEDSIRRIDKFCAHIETLLISKVIFDSKMFLLSIFIGDFCIINVSHQCSRKYDSWAIFANDEVWGFEPPSKLILEITSASAS